MHVACIENDEFDSYFDALLLILQTERNHIREQIYICKRFSDSVPLIPGAAMLIIEYDDNAKCTYIYKPYSSAVAQLSTEQRYPHSPHQILE